MPRFLGLSLGQQPCTMAMNPNPVILPKSPTESPRAKGSDLFHLLPEFSDFFLFFSSSWYMLILFSWHLPAMPTMVNVSRLGSQKCFQKSQLLGECELHQTASKHLTESVIKKKIDLGIPWWAGLWSGAGMSLVTQETVACRHCYPNATRYQIPEHGLYHVISPAKWPNGHSHWMNQKQPVPSGATVGCLAEFPWASLAMKKVSILGLPKYAWYPNSPLK